MIDNNMINFLEEEIADSMLNKNPMSSVHDISVFISSINSVFKSTLKFYNLSYFIDEKRTRIFISGASSSDEYSPHIKNYKCIKIEEIQDILNKKSGISYGK